MNQSTPAVLFDFFGLQAMRTTQEDDVFANIPCNGRILELIAFKMNCKLACTQHTCNFTRVKYDLFLSWC